MPTTTAIAGEDYETTIVQLTFSSTNQNSPECVRVPINDDNNTEGAELFFGELRTEQDRVTLDPNRTSITILDDDSKVLEPVA